MKKRIVSVLIMAVLSCQLLAGCGSSSKADDYKKLGIQQMQTGDYDSAVNSFQKALDQSNGLVGDSELDLCYYKALAQYKAGDTQDAIDTYSAIIDFKKKSYKAYYLRGNVYLLTGDTTNAEADYATAATLEPSIELYANIYDNLKGAGLDADADSYMQTALSMKASDAEDYYWLGDMCLNAEDYANAADYASKAEEAGDDDAILLSAKILIAQGDNDAATAKLDEYMEKYPNDPNAIAQMGAIAIAGGDYDTAISYISEAMQSDDFDNDANVLKCLIAAYEYTGDFASACDVAKDYVGLYPDDDEVSREYTFLQTRVAESANNTATDTTAEITDETSVEGTTTNEASADADAANSN